MPGCIYGLLGLGLAFAGCDDNHAALPGTLAPVTVANFRSRVIQNKQPVLVEFSRLDCAPCHELEPLLVQLAKEHAGKLMVVQILVDHESEALAKEYQVREVPTLIVFVNGDVKQRTTGVPAASALAQLVKPYLNTPK